MIESQLRPNNIIDENLISAFSRVKQENFLPESLKKLSYIDDHINVTDNCFILKPLIFAKFLNILKLDSSDTILEVGSGLGYTASVLSNLVKDVYSIEQDKNAYDQSIKNVNYYQATNIKIIHSSYRQDKIPEIKFDKILINGSVNSDPANFLEKLKINGKLVCVLDVESYSNIYLYNKKLVGYEKIKITSANAPILINYIDKEKFNF